MYLERGDQLDMQKRTDVHDDVLRHQMDRFEGNRDHVGNIRAGKRG